MTPARFFFELLMAEGRSYAEILELLEGLAGAPAAAGRRRGPPPAGDEGQDPCEE
jgi:hypothetical protein